MATKEKYLDEPLTYKNLSYDDIEEWCVANNQVEWLKEEMARTVPQKVFPRVKTPKLGLDGKPLTKQKVNKDTGKVSTVLVYETKVDKTQPYTLVDKKITFVQIKEDFVNKFMPELHPKKKAKKPSMFDRVKNL